MTLRFRSFQPPFSLRAAACTAVLALSAAGSAGAVTIHTYAHQSLERTARDLYGAKLPHALRATITVINDPADPTFNQLLSIDDLGTIAGYYGSGAAGHPNRAYTITPPYTQFVPTSVPAATQTQVQSLLSGGTSSGFWAPSNSGTDENFGFIKLKNGTTLYLDVNDPLVASTPVVNQVLGINTSGNAAGFYNDVNGLSHGYTYSVSTGRFTPIVISGTASTAAFGINASNVVCGDYTNYQGVTKAFLLNVTNNTGLHYQVPNSPNTEFFGVNNSGVAVGFYIGSDQIPHGLIYDSVAKKTYVVDAPGAAGGTVLNGINSSGQIVGFSMNAAGNTEGILVNGAY
jgi:hypothetical protein